MKRRKNKGGTGRGKQGWRDGKGRDRRRRKYEGKEE